MRTSTHTSESLSPKDRDNVQLEETCGDSHEKSGGGPHRAVYHQPTICNDEIGWYGVLLPVIVFPFCETLQIECPEGCVTIVVLGGIKENLVIRR
jgi:hypothetical protein